MALAAAALLALAEADTGIDRLRDAAALLARAACHRAFAALHATILGSSFFLVALLDEVLVGVAVRPRMEAAAFLIVASLIRWAKRALCALQLTSTAPIPAPSPEIPGVISWNRLR